MKLPSQKSLFDIPAEVTWLNCAQHSPALRSVEAAGRAGLARKRHPWTLGPQQYVADVGRLRDLAAGLIGAQGQDIALVPSASYGLTIAANNLRIGEGRHVVVLAEQFPSHVYPWREAVARDGGSIVTVARPDPGSEGWTALVLEAIDENCAVVALPGFHWTDGACIDLERVSRAARAVGAALVLDLSQSLGAVPFDVAKIDPDFMVSVCYKWLLGPYNYALLYAAPRRQNGVGLEQTFMARVGGGNSAGLTDYQDDLLPDARRYDMGERGNYISIPMAIAGLEQIAAWGVEAIAETQTAIVEEIATRAAALGLDPTPPALRAPHFLGLRFREGVPEGLVEALQEKSVYLSQRGSSLRISPHLWNDASDIDRLFGALEDLL